MESGHWQLRREIEVCAERVETCRHHQPETRRRRRQVRIRLVQGTTRVAVETTRKSGLVDLDPISASLLQTKGHLGADRKKPRQHFERSKTGIPRAAEQKVGHRTDHDRPGMDAEILCLEKLFDRVGQARAERLATSKLWHQIAIIGGEPRSHLRPWSFAPPTFTVLRSATGRLNPLGHREICIEGNPPAFSTIGRRDGTNHDGSVDSMVIEREVIGCSRRRPSAAASIPQPKGAPPWRKAPLRQSHANRSSQGTS